MSSLLFCIHNGNDIFCNIFTFTNQYFFYFGKLLLFIWFIDYATGYIIILVNFKMLSMFKSQYSCVSFSPFHHIFNFIKHMFLFPYFLRKINSKQSIFTHYIKLITKQLFFIKTNPFLVLALITIFLFSIIHKKLIKLWDFTFWFVLQLSQCANCIFELLDFTFRVNFIISVILKLIKNNWLDHRWSDQCFEALLTSAFFEKSILKLKLDWFRFILSLIKYVC